MEVNNQNQAQAGLPEGKTPVPAEEEEEARSASETL
jgi:hypothetical protein